MKWIFILILFVSHRGFSQPYNAEISVNLKEEYFVDLKDSLFNILVVSSGFLKEFNVKNKQIVNVDSIPAKNLFIIVSCLKRYKTLNVVKNFYNDTTVYFDSSSLIKLEMPFPPDCIYNKNIKTKRCTKCNKTDKVIPIYYDVTYLKYYKKKPVVDSFPGTQISLEYCSPTWYCKRDRLEF